MNGVFTTTTTEPAGAAKHSIQPIADLHTQATRSGLPLTPRAEVYRISRQQSLLRTQDARAIRVAGPLVRDPPAVVGLVLALAHGQPATATSRPRPQIPGWILGNACPRSHLVLLCRSLLPRSLFPCPRPPPQSVPAPPPMISLPPSLPAALMASETAPKLSTQEMTVMWEKILPLLATCIEARKSYLDSDKDMQNFEAMLSTSRFKQLGTDADRARVEQERTRLTGARDEASKEFTKSLHALKDTAWWPVGPNQDDGAAEKYREIIRTRARGATPAPPVDGPSQQQRESSDPRPLKRRRVSDAADDAPALDTASVAELESIQTDVQRLEDQVAEIQNELHTFQTTAMDDMANQIQARMEGLALDAQGIASTGGGADLDGLRTTTTETSKNVDELAVMVASLMEQSETLGKKEEALRNEVEQQKVQFAAMQTQFDAFQREIDQDKDTLRALTTAFEKLEAQQPPPAPTLPLDFILAAIDEPVRDTVQSIVRPMVDDLDRDLKEKIANQDKETYGNLWAKIGLTLKVVNAVNNVTQAEPVVGKSKGKSKSPSTNQTVVAQTVS
ncbi:hypothetical protein MSAN_01001400 [Mycena sanguinolenta]|uniref:Uncharacterized protein n=1 Tax=Mycena sanguinolenta TaxID=230812 RepID=A0A8H6YSC5_9AGAR|nr:hypothetical protein MSAN_01001400 [Mycena sanguinolenta]